MQGKILSVIIPVYNVEAYLNQCIDSVLSQDLENFEVICVNDGSTDNSRNILQEYKDKHNDLIVVDRANGGLPAARNSGFKVASGKYIYFLDSDDYLFPGVLKQMVDFSERNVLDIANFNVEISTGDRYFEIPANPESVLKGSDYFNFLSKYNLSLPASPVWMYLYNKSFLDSFKISFKEGIVLEDNHYTLRVLLLAQRVHLFNMPIQHHRIQRVGAETHTVTKEQIESLLFTCRDLFLFYNKKKCKEESFYTRIFMIYLNIAARVLILKNYKDENFTKQDFQIMKKCISNNNYILHYYLLKHKLFHIYRWYIDDSKQLYLKKNLRRIMRLYWKLFVRNV